MSTQQLDKIGILVGPKGRGTNMMAIHAATVSGDLPATVQVVISAVDDTPAVQNARDADLRVAIVPPGDDYGERLLAELDGCDWVCLAGYTRLLPDEVLQAFPRRVLNIHPALLPKFGGKGMYGIRVHEAVIEAKEAETGCSVHFVTEHYDEGEVILQLSCAVQPGDRAEDVAARVLELEKVAYAQALRKLIDARNA